MGHKVNNSNLYNQLKKIKQMILVNKPSLLATLMRNKKVKESIN